MLFPEQDQDFDLCSNPVDSFWVSTMVLNSIIALSLSHTSLSLECRQTSRVIPQISLCSLDTLPSEPIEMRCSTVLIREMVHLAGSRQLTGDVRRCKWRNFGCRVGWRRAIRKSNLCHQERLGCPKLCHSPIHLIFFVETIISHCTWAFATE